MSALFQLAVSLAVVALDVCLLVALVLLCV